MYTENMCRSRRFVYALPRERLCPQEAGDPGKGGCAEDRDEISDLKEQVEKDSCSCDPEKKRGGDAVSCRARFQQQPGGGDTC